MNKVFAITLSFAAGGTIGFLTAHKLLKDRYEQLVQDEIESVKAAFKQENLRIGENANRPSEEERQKFNQAAVNLGYTQQKTPEPVQLPRVISPDEYGELNNYEELSLTYYADGTVTDDNDRAMSDVEIEESIGKDSLTHFGEYEADSVFVRNDRLKVDYEILADQRTYADVLREKPWLVQ